MAALNKTTLIICAGLIIIIIIIIIITHVKSFTEWRIACVGWPRIS